MKVILKEVSRPMISGFTVFADPNFSILKEKKTIKVKPYKESKTRISTSIQFGEYSVKINWKIDGFKFDEKVVTNMWHDTTTKVNYFKLLKSQTWEDYKLYVIELIKQYIKMNNLNLDEITIELENL